MRPSIYRRPSHALGRGAALRSGTLGAVLIVALLLLSFPAGAALGGPAAGGTHDPSPPAAAALPPAAPAPQDGAGVVTGTLVLANGTYVSGNFQSTLAGNPTSPTYDPVTGSIYIADSDSDNISVLNTSTDLTVGNYPTGTYSYGDSVPMAIALDASNGDLYIANSGDDTVLVWDPVSHSNVTTIAAGSIPDAIAYDPVDGDLFVADSGSTTVTVIDGTSNMVVATVGVGTPPNAVTVDTANGEVFVGTGGPEYGSANVTVLSPSNYAVLANLPLDPTLNYPIGACFDPQDAHIFVTDGDSGNVTVINGTTNRYVTTVSVGSPDAPFGTYPDSCAFDSGDARVYVADGYYDVVDVLDPTTDSVPSNVSVGDLPTGIAFDPQNDRLYTTNEASGNMTVIQGGPLLMPEVVANPGLTTQPWDVAFDPASENGFATDDRELLTPADVIGFHASTGGVGPYTPVAPPGSEPYSPGDDLYDPANGDVYAAASYYDSASAATYGDVAVINGGTGALVSTIESSGFLPICLAYDPSNQVLYVGSIVDDQDVLIGYNAANTQVSFLPLPSLPQAIAYDSANGDLYVDALGSGPPEVIVVDPVTNTIVGTIPVGFESGPAIAYDPANQEIFVSNVQFNLTTFEEYDLSVVNTTTNQIVANISFGGTPGAPGSSVYDPANGDIYVTDTGSNNVSVVNGTRYTLVATIPVGDFPVGISTNGSGAQLYVANYDDGSISIISLPSRLVINSFTASASWSNSVVASVPVGIGPYAVAYDSGKGEVFVANDNATVFLGYSGNGNVSVISDATNTVVATVPVGYDPSGVAYDSGKGEVFVTSGNNVSVISDTTNKVVVTVPVGTSPAGAAYDSGKGEVFVANTDSNNVSVINDTTNTIVATVTVGDNPYGVAYDSGKGEVFVTNSNYYSVGSNVSVINDTTNTVVATVAVGTAASGVAYDSGKGEVFVTHGEYNTVDVISDATNTVVATAVTTVDVSDSPNSVAYDSGKGELFVTDYSFGGVQVISDASNTVVAMVPVGPDPQGVAYDSSTGEVFVANYNSNNVSVINGETVSVGSSVTLSTIASGGLPPYTYTYTGLPPGCTSQNASSLVCIPTAAGTYSVTVFVNDSAQNSVNATISLTVTTVSVPTYSVTFTESGLPSGTSWSVTLAGSPQTSTNSAITFTEANGTYAYTVGSVSGYTASPSSGSETVAGAAVSITITFTAVSVTTYTVTFSESGLPSGTSWSVTLEGSPQTSTTRTIAFSEANGTYAYTVGSVSGYTASPSSGSVTVTGAAVSVTITFTSVSVPTYTVTFVEVGMPTAAGGGISFNGGSPTAFTNGGTVVFSDVANGTYPYTAVAGSGYTEISATLVSPVTVSGASVTVIILLAPTYAVTFAQTGIPSGTTWTVQATLTSTTPAAVMAGSVGMSWFANSTGPTALLPLVNGTYSDRITASGYQTATGGPFTVNGQAETLPSVAVSPSPSSSPGVSSWVYAIIGVVIAAVVVGVVIGLMRRRRPPAVAIPPPPPTPRS